MRCIGINLGHDGAIAVLEDKSLLFSIEAEKDNHDRYAAFTPMRLGLLLKAHRTSGAVIGYSGWNYHNGPLRDSYYGLTSRSVMDADAGESYFVSPHERAHILSSFALSPFPEGEPCYVLVWEGTIGNLYCLREDLSIDKMASILAAPGRRFSLLYELADPAYADSSRGYSADVAGKLMALAGFSSGGTCSIEEADLIERLLAREADICKASFRDSHIYNVGVEHHSVAQAVRHLSERMFDLFAREVRAHVAHRLNLVIAGGCGLNCEWNSRWRDSGLFNDVFVAPVTNDSGVAIGAAVDAQYARTGTFKISWSVYSGEALREDSEEIAGFERKAFSVEAVASVLTKGAIVAWARGKYEMGPRALGNRSILAAPFSPRQRVRLNEIKRREQYRPIAPVCTEGDANKWFKGGVPSPHMLYFSRVCDDRLNAVRHVDGSARIQTLSEWENPILHQLLCSFAEKNEGVSVLCNTSLNDNGKGFFNKASDIATFAIARGLDAVVLESRLFVRAGFGKS